MRMFGIINVIGDVSKASVPVVNIPIAQNAIITPKLAYSMT